MYKENHIKEILKRDGRIVPFDQEQITLAIYKAAGSVGGHDRALSEKLSDEVVKILNDCFEKNATPSVEDIQDMVEKVLIENGHAQTSKAYILYRAERTRMRQKQKDRSKAQERYPDNIPYDIIWRILLWNVEHNCDTIEKLNGIIDAGKFCELVEQSEREYLSGVDFAANEIIKDKDNIRFVIVAGPSSSGKTTTTKKIGKRLAKEGLEFVELNIDNYFFDLEMHPKDEYGDYDFETPEALDLQLIREHLQSLLHGKEIQTPVYDFKTGKRLKETKTFTLKKHQICLLDTLHGLYQGMTGVIPDQNKFRIYIELLCQVRDSNGMFLRWADMRMLRRMIRDMQFRKYDPAMTVGHWHYVRNSELKHIIPFMGNADCILSGALAYELPVLKKYLIKYFPEILDKFIDDPKKKDALIRTNRIFKALKEVHNIEDISCIPDDSLIREFIGGSSLQY